MSDLFPKGDLIGLRKPITQPMVILTLWKSLSLPYS